MRLKIILLFFFFLGGKSRGQEKKLNAVHHEGEYAQDVWAFILNGNQYIKQNKGDSAVYTFYTAVEESFYQNNKNLFDTSLALFVKYAHNWSSDIDSNRAVMFKNALAWGQHFKLSYDKLLPLAYFLGSYFHNINEYEPAIKYYTNIVDYNLSPKDSALSLTKSKALNGLVNIWIFLNDIEEARNCTHKMKELTVKFNDPHLAVYANRSNGEIQKYFNNVDSYSYFLNRALTYHAKVEEKCMCADIINIAYCDIYIKKGEALRALDTAKKSYLRFVEHNQKKIDKGYYPLKESGAIISCRFLFTHAYFQAQQYALSIKEAQKLLEDGGETLPFIVKVNTLNVLWQAFAHIGNYEDALFASSKLLSLWRVSDKLIEKSNLRAFNYKLEQEKKVSQQQLVIERQNNQINKNKILLMSGGIATVLVLVIIGGGYKAVKNKERLQASQLQNMHQEKSLQTLQSKIEGEEFARKEIARELHDGVGSQLLVTKLSLSSLSQSNHLDYRDKSQLFETIRQLEDIAIQLRNTTHNLMPDLILREGLVFAIAAYLEKIKKSKVLIVDFQKFGNPPELPEAITVQLFRMVQECIQNVIKHAKASKLFVQLNYAAGILSITIEDNGVGFDTESLDSDGLGIANMKKRIKEIGGTIQMESQPQKGCTVYIELDFQA